MYKGQTLIANDGYEVALYPQTACTITQTSYGTYSHRCKNQTNSGLFDVVCVSGSKEPIYSPFSCKVVAFKSGYTNGNQCMLQSLNKVHTANGQLQYVTWGFAHDNTLSLTIGQTFNQGDLIGHNGDYGYVTGVHSHLILYAGAWPYGNSIPTCVSKSVSNIYYSPNPIDLDDLFYANNTTMNTTTKDSVTFTWKYWEEKTTTLTDNDIMQVNNSSYNYIEFNSHVSNPKYQYWVTLVAGNLHQNIGNTLDNINQNVGSEWELIARCTGGIAWSDINTYDTMNGLLKKNWTWIEQYDDTEYDNLLAVGGNGDNTILKFDLQSNMREYSGEWAITGVCPLNSSSGMSGVAINSTTGHGFIGQKSDGTIFLGISKSGTAGSTARNYFSNLGYTGVELDGGGSTFFQYTKGTSYTDLYHNRTLKNAILVYRKTNTPSTTTYYTVTLSSNNDNGIAKGSGTYASGSTITIYAIPNDKHKFIKWSDDNTNAERTITVNSNISLTAYFDGTKEKTGGLIISGYAGIDFQII